MVEEPKPMHEIHRIQKRLSEKDRGLSPRQRILRIHDEAAALIGKYRLKLRVPYKA